MAVADKHVVIVGAGMGGLTAAIALEQLARERSVNVRITVLDQDASAADKMARHRNLSVSIQGDSGVIPVLKKLGVEQSARRTQTSSSAYFVADTDGRAVRDLLVVGPAADPTSIRAKRMPFWKVLHDRVPTTVSLQFNSSVTAVRLPEHAGDCVELSLADGRTIRADVVIAADGSRSTLRQLLAPHETLRFAHMAIISGQHSGALPAVARRRHGMIFAPGMALWLSHEGEERCQWGLALPMSAPWPDMAADGTDHPQLHAEAVRLAEEAFPADIVATVVATPAGALRVFNCYDKMPHGSVEGCVAFIGDASHPVTPFSGNGANMAIVDGMRLAETLTDPDYKYSLGDALAAFDQEMIKRTARVVSAGRRAIEEAFDATLLRRVSRAVALRCADLFTNHQFVAVGAIGVALAAVGAGLVALFRHLPSRST